MPTRRFSKPRQRGDGRSINRPELAEIDIARPSMLLGDRSKQRMNETLLRRCSVCYQVTGNPLMRETCAGHAGRVDAA